MICLSLFDSKAVDKAPNKRIAVFNFDDAKPHYIKLKHRTAVNMGRLAEMQRKLLEVCRTILLRPHCHLRV